MHRRLIFIRGDRQAGRAAAEQLTAHLDTLDIHGVNNINQVLGREYDAVVCDLHDGFSTSAKEDNQDQTYQSFNSPINLNTFGAAVGVIRGGGVLIILLPASSDAMNPGRFHRRFMKLLSSQSFAESLQVGQSIEPLLPLKPSVPERFLTYGCIMPDQLSAVEGVIKVARGHRRRPLLICSDRGRGKSAALGLAAAHLLNEGIDTVLVCAPSRKAAAVVFEQAIKRVDNPLCLDRLEFVAADELLHNLPATALLLIDEAAAIPLGMLKTIVTHYARVVLSTTLHGYEGSGRGFATRFGDLLDNTSPGWKRIELKTPVRWSPNDPLEQFIFKALLLDAEPVLIDAPGSMTLKNVTFKALDREELSLDEQSLNNLFGLLVSAHYQTRPSDLIYLLDDESFRIACLTSQGRIVAAALLASEGGFDKKTAKQVFEGRRRLQGHLVAQALAANAGLLQGPCLAGERIVRIAVHPRVQRQGLGSELVRQVLQYSEAQYVSTSFGATPGLLRFWKQSGFEPVHMGVRRDSSSGSHSVIMLAIPPITSAMARSAAGHSAFRQLRERFCEAFPHQLSDTLVDLETDIVMPLLCAPPCSPQGQSAHGLISAEDRAELAAFANGQRAYENSVLAIWKLVLNRLANAAVSTETLPPDEKRILVLKILQKRDWAQVVEGLGGAVSGKKAALKLLRHAIRLLLDSVPDDSFPNNSFPNNKPKV